MSRKKRSQHDWVGVSILPACSTGKRGFSTRGEAKVSAKKFFLEFGERMSPYRCDECAMFHIGHLSPQVIQGQASRNERTGVSETETMLILALHKDGKGTRTIAHETGINRSLVMNTIQAIHPLTPSHNNLHHP